MDLIDRQALLAEVRDDIRRGCFDQQTVINNIEYAPTVEPKRGEWEWDEHYKEWICTHCKYPLPNQFGFDSKKWKPTLNFCPNCGSYNGGKRGADMKGENK